MLNYFIKLNWELKFYLFIFIRVIKKLIIKIYLQYKVINKYFFNKFIITFNFEINVATVFLKTLY